MNGGMKQEATQKILDGATTMEVLGQVCCLTIVLSAQNCTVTSDGFLGNWRIGSSVKRGGWETLLLCVKLN